MWRRISIDNWHVCVVLCWASLGQECKAALLQRFCAKVERWRSAAVARAVLSGVLLSCRAHSRRGTELQQQISEEQGQWMHHRQRSVLASIQRIFAWLSLNPTRAASGTVVLWGSEGENSFSSRPVWHTVYATAFLVSRGSSQTSISLSPQNLLNQTCQTWWPRSSGWLQLLSVTLVSGADGTDDGRGC